MKMKWLGLMGIVLLVSITVIGCGKEERKKQQQLPLGDNEDSVLLQASTTDDAGKASFLTSQGQIVTFEIKDDTTQQALSDISVKFSEGLNNTIMAYFEDQTGSHMPAVLIDQIIPSEVIPKVDNHGEQNKKLQAPRRAVEPVSFTIGVLLVAGALEVAWDFGNEIYNFRNTLKEFNYFLPEQTFIGCITVEKAAELLKAQAIGLKSNLKLLLVISDGFDHVPIDIAGKAIQDMAVKDFIDQLVDQIWGMGTIIPARSKQEIVAVKIHTTKLLNALLEGGFNISKATPEYCGTKVPPSPPLNLQVKNASHNSITLSWASGSTNIEGYQIERSMDGTNVDLKVITPADETQFTDNWLLPNTSYQYHVRALNLAGPSDETKLQAKTLDRTNRSPVISSLVATPSSVNTGSASTVICNASDPDNHQLMYAWTKTGGSISDSGSTVTWTAPSIAGTYIITCNVSDGKGGVSRKGVNITVSNATPTPPIGTAPPGNATLTPPGNLSATAESSSRVNLSWSDVSPNEDGFKIERKAGSTGTYAEIQTVGVNTINYVDLGLTANTLYCYKVRAFSSAGDSAYSNESCTTTLGNVGTIEVIAALDGSAWPGDVNYAITGPANTSGTEAPATFSSRPAGTYTLTYNSGGPSGAIFTGINPSATQTLNSDGTISFILNFTTQSSPVISVVPGGIVDFGSVAVGESTSRVYSVSNTGNGTLTGNVSVAAPFSVHSDGQIQGSFSIPAGQGQSLVIRFSPTSAGTFNGTVNITSNGGDATRSVTGVGVTPPSTTPAAPSSLSATALSSSLIALAWQDNADSESGFKIERKTGTTGSFSQLAVVGALSGTGEGGYFENSGLSASTSYCYRVRAYNGTGDSSYSNETCATTQTPPPVLPSATTGSATNITSISATLNGTINPNGVSTGAFFQWGTSSSYGNLTSPQTLGSGTTNVSVSANLTGLSPNTTYHFRIVASNGGGGTTFGADQIFTTGSASGPTERITNGSFSSGTAGWILSGDFWAGTNLSNYRTSPGYAAGGVDNAGQPKNSAIGTMYQTVTIPATATTATLSFWYNITSQETGSTPFDVLNVTIQNSSGSFLATVAVRSNLHKGAVGVYTQVPFDVTAYKGQTIRVHFLAATDSGLNTVFRIDDVSLMADGN